jgi:S1-C subfamily serine protease
MLQMRRRFPARPITSTLLLALSLCALIMSIIFFSHVRRNLGTSAVPHDHALPGVTLAPTGHDFVVTSIRSDGEAAQEGVSVGDEIVAIDGKSFRSLDQVDAYLLKAHNKEIELELREGNQTQHVLLTLGED